MNYVSCAVVVGAGAGVGLAFALGLGLGPGIVDVVCVHTLSLLHILSRRTAWAVWPD